LILFLVRWVRWPGSEFAQLLIKKALSSSPKTPRELLDITGLPERTLRYHLMILKKHGIVKELPVLGDLRRKIFILARGD